MLNLFAILLLGIFIYYQTKKLENQRIEREKVFEKWLFDSLYSISNKVLLPTEQEKPMLNKKGKVYKPGEDPMAEFNGMKDDL